MSETVTTPVLEETIEEARSVFATLIANIVSVIRTLIIYILEISRKLVTYIGEHPLATLLLVTNVCILVS